MYNRESNVIGILIETEYKDFKMHQVKFKSEHYEGENVFRGRINTSSRQVEGLENILLDLSHEENPATQFVIVYNASCPKKEEHIKTLLSEINSRKKNELLPSLVSIGQEEYPLSEDIIRQISQISEVADTGNFSELLEKIVQNKAYHAAQEVKIRKKILQQTTVSLSKCNDNYSSQENSSTEESSSAPYLKNSQQTIAKTTSTGKISSQDLVKPSSEKNSCLPGNMQILGGFIAVLGIAAVVIAFTVLSMGIIPVASIGVVAIIAGIGLFAKGSDKSNQGCFSDLTQPSMVF